MEARGHCPLNFPSEKIESFLVGLFESLLKFSRRSVKGEVSAEYPLPKLRDWRSVAQNGVKPRPKSKFFSN